MPGNIREKIEEEFANVLQNAERRKIRGFEKRNAYGHEAGMPIEEWVKGNLEKINWGNERVYAYFPNEFLSLIFSKIGKDRERIEKVVQQAWWGPLLVSKKQIRDFMSGKTVRRWQQEGADIVLFYGEDPIGDLDDIVLINVKSHDASRMSRPPNIMSAQRLLEFFFTLLQAAYFVSKIDKANLWFLGVYYAVTSEGAIVNEVHLRDLFRLDLDKLPQINFDAAIQIQWHVKDMVEIEQDKLTFIESLADTFINQWRNHSGRKEEKYEGLVGNVKTLVSRMRKLSNRQTV
jgi:hypothetical protein